MAPRRQVVPSGANSTPAEPARDGLATHRRSTASILMQLHLWRFQAKVVLPEPIIAVQLVEENSLAIQELLRYPSTDWLIQRSPQHLERVTDAEFREQFEVVG